MRNLIITLLLAGLVTGCGDKQEKKPAAPDKGKDVEKVMEDVEEEVEEAIEEEEVEEAMEEAEEEVEEAIEEAGMVEEAKAMLAAAMNAIKAGSLDDAKDLLEQLNEVKDDLPADLGKQIDAAWSALKAKQAAGSVGLPK